MLGSITPLGERGRGAVWGRTVTTYIVASTASGAGVGALLGWAGVILGMGRSWGLLVLGAGCLLGLAADQGLAGLRVPTIRRQVADSWMRLYRDWIYGGGFGLQLGAGIGTIVSASAVYLTLITEFLVGSVPAGIVIGLTFGFVRSSTILLAGRVRTPEALMRLHSRLDSARLPISRLSGGAQAVTGLAAIAGGLHMM